MLRLEGIHAGYGDTRVLFNLGFAVQAGQMVTLLGRNGMGKTTTLRVIMGLLPASQGGVWLDEQPLHGEPPHRIAQRGLGLVPEGRQVFPTLSVAENLLASARPGPWDLARVYALFPRLRERRGHHGNQLSGGEQQMLAIGRALMTNPRLLILDEATEGLAPLIREEIWACLTRLREEQLSILIVDKNVERLTRLADHHVVIEKGAVVWTGSSAELAAAGDVKQRYLGV